MLAIFDLDNTLIGGDSDYLWGCFLANRGDQRLAEYERKNRHFYQQYQAGELDIHEFLRFSLKPLTEYSLETLNTWRAEFVEQEIRPILLPAAEQLIRQHRLSGHTLLIITATNRFVTEPIAELLGIDQLIATEPEMINGHYTGQVSGEPSFRDGKVIRLKQWMAEYGISLGASLDQSWFYSDSHNDLPLLELVTHPVAVDADETLKRHAKDHGWPIISLRE